VAEKDSLRHYREKRDFGATAEPRGQDDPRGQKERGDEPSAEQPSVERQPGEEPACDTPSREERGGEPSYVIQIHDARRVHFDFRLEVDGVLKSWAVPKGPSTDPEDKRLAVPTEDHPLEYLTYEGVIGGGQYGAGTVIVWDTGSYRPLLKKAPHDGDDKAAFARALEEGHASFVLNGSKLHGGYSLTRFRDGKDGSEEAWLLVKRADSGADRGGHATPDPHRARSARSGRTLRQVAAQEEDGG
jgi:DNA ligase D-like protein (predicted 3'-phosphoesterase)